jgi:hypothetical protein
MVPAPVLGPTMRQQTATDPARRTRLPFGRTMQGGAMADQSELRATSDSMLTMLDRVRELESRKRELAPGTQEFAQLAWEVAELARVLVRWSELQLRQANEFLEEPPTPKVALVDVAPRRLDVVLAEWRQAEMRLSQAPPGSEDAEAAARDVARLRDEYGVLQERKLDEQRAR